MTKFKSVSVRDITFDEIKRLSSELLPQVKLSNAQTIDRITSIAKKSLQKIQTGDLNGSNQKK